MTSSLPITTLFLDIGGVLLTNGRDRGMRILASEKFGLDLAEMDERHHLTFDTDEEVKPSLSGWLKDWAAIAVTDPRRKLLSDSGLRCSNNSLVSSVGKALQSRWRLQDDRTCS